MAAPAELAGGGASTRVTSGRARGGSTRREGGCSSSSSSRSDGQPQHAPPAPPAPPAASPRGAAAARSLAPELQQAEGCGGTHVGTAWGHPHWHGVEAWCPDQMAANRSPMAGQGRISQPPKKASMRNGSPLPLPPPNEQPCLPHLLLEDLRCRGGGHEGLHHGQSLVDVCRPAWETAAWLARWRLMTGSHPACVGGMTGQRRGRRGGGAESGRWQGGGHQGGWQTGAIRGVAEGGHQGGGRGGASWCWRGQPRTRGWLAGCINSW